MNVSRQKLLILMTLVIGVSLVTAGCSSKQPAKPEPGTPKEVANIVETETVKVEGVNKATALVADRTIYIGLELKEKYDELQAASIEQSVLDRITYLEPEYNIAVSSDRDMVQKIKNVAMGFAQGNRLSTYSNEIMQLDQEIRLKKEAIYNRTGTTAIQ